jgi:hypothetical protein
MKTLRVLAACAVAAFLAGAAGAAPGPLALPFRVSADPAFAFFPATAAGSSTAAVPLGVAIATGNPLGLIVTSGVKVYGEASGSSNIEGRVQQTATELAQQIKPRFQQQGWIN